MKENPQNKVLREHLGPSPISPKGFLGDDKRPVEEIILEDIAKCNELGFTPEEIGECLEAIHIHADNGWESEVHLYNGKLSVIGYETLGRIPCPFGCGKSCHKAMIRVQYGDKTFEFSPLSAHMIAEHAFFGGIGSEFRIPPEQLKEIYDITQENLPK